MTMDLFEFDEVEKNNSSNHLDLKINNFEYIIGTDEAGRGPAAGGVWASACAFKNNIDKSLFLKLNDSKKLSSKNRENLYEKIMENCYYSIKTVEVEEIEKINILNASLLAMKHAVEDVIGQIKSNNVLVLVDGNKLIKNFNYPQKFIIKGDQKSASIASSSILAKVNRDKFMDKIDKIYPQYDWKNNKGYLTKKHIEAIEKFGITEFHRKSFLKNILENKSPRTSSEAEYNLLNLI